MKIPQMRNKFLSLPLNVISIKNIIYTLLIHKQLNRIQKETNLFWLLYV